MHQLRPSNTHRRLQLLHRNCFVGFTAGGIGVLFERTIPHRPQQRRQERQRNKHRNRDVRRRRITHIRQERNIRDAQPNQRDNNRQTSENNRRTSGAGRQPNRIEPTSPMPQLIAITRHNKQRIINTDGQPQHESKRWRHGIQRHQRRRPHRDQRPNTNTNHRRDQRHPRSEQTTKRHRKNNERHDQPRDLTDRLNRDRVAIARAADLNGHARIARNRGGIFDRLAILLGHINGQRHVESETHCAVAAIIGVRAQRMRIQPRRIHRKPHLNFPLHELLLQPLIHRHRVFELQRIAQVRNVLF